MRTQTTPSRPQLQTCVITIPAAVEHDLDPVVWLPAAKPETPQFTWTIGAGDMVTFSQAPVGVTKFGVVILGGQNTDESPLDCFVEIYVNSVLGASFNIAPGPGLYWTAELWTNNAQEGDVIEVYLWSSEADKVDYRYNATQVQYTGYSCSRPGEVLAPLEALEVVSCPTLTGGVVPNKLPDHPAYFLLPFNPDLELFVQLTGPGYLEAWACNRSYGLFYAAWQPYGGLVYYWSCTDADLMPNYNANILPVSFRWRNHGRPAGVAP